MGVHRHHTQCTYVTLSLIRHLAHRLQRSTNISAGSSSTHAPSVRVAAIVDGAQHRLDFLIFDLIADGEVDLLTLAT